MEEEQKDCSSPNLTAEQKQLIQKNRERAREVRERKKRVKPYDRPANTPNELVIEHPVVGANSRDHSTALQNAGLRNSHAGFMFDEEDDDSCQQHTYHRVEEEGILNTQGQGLLPRVWYRMCLINPTPSTLLTTSLSKTSHKPCKWQNQQPELRVTVSVSP